MYKIKTINNIDKSIHSIFDDKYSISSKEENPHGIIVRSANLHNLDFGDNLLAIARAGAGVNNIPLDKLQSVGIPVFNAPGANSNAVKELILCSMMMASRNFIEAFEWTSQIKAEEGIEKLVEDGKKKFIGTEIQGKTLGVIGLGYVGRQVANVAVELGMKVLGYDPYINIDGAWSLHRNVIHAINLADVLKKSDYITLHVPLTDTTRELINDKTIKSIKKDCVLLNFARGELVDNIAIVKAIKEKRLYKYVNDFPSKDIIGYENIICLPHLGASTPEAEIQCAKMAAREIKDYIEKGIIVNSVNFPTVNIPLDTKYRVVAIHKNIKNMISVASGIFSKYDINIENIISQSKGDIAYMLIDVNDVVVDEVLDELKNYEGFIRIRLIKS